MRSFVVTAVAELEATDDLTAWQQAHRMPQHLKWQVAAVAPIERPDDKVIFDTPTGARLARVQMSRAVRLAAVIVAAAAFPSHLVVSSLMTGTW